MLLCYYKIKDIKYLKIVQKLENDIKSKKNDFHEFQHHPSLNNNSSHPGCEKRYLIKAILFSKYSADQRLRARGGT